MKQMLDLVTCGSCSGRGTAEMVDALNEVSETAHRHLGGSIEHVANTWSDAQATISDAIFRRTSAQSAGNGPSPAAEKAHSGAEQGWGPVPPVGGS
jgi:hypothetical protein